MFLVKVALLTLLHPQQVVVNGTRIVRQGAKLEVSGNLHNKLTFTGKLLVAVNQEFRRHYVGELEVTSKNDELQLLLKTNSEDLVAAIVSAESPPGAPPAALEAQAILARSWIAASRGRHGQFDLCDTTHCQHFKEPAPAGVRAARNTAGLHLVWQGRPFAPAYSASCGGRTKTAEAIGWDDQGKYPYFAVDCPICVRDEPRWTRRFDDADLTEIRVHPHQERFRLAIGRRLGWSALPGNNYEIDGSEVVGKGQGHGLGYCQRGGAGMAKQGASVAAILNHYFPGTAIISSR
ncbi:MAG: hypothetical protein HYX27_08200 [Acidobacteria bacterium]|nr:hypothetical protein [Acidobacteriota bacterium]